MALHSFHVSGSISDAAFSFIVHDPSGIIDVSRPMSLRSSPRTYRIICVSEQCVLNTGCVSNADVRLNGGSHSEVTHTDKCVLGARAPTYKAGIRPGAP